MKRTVLLCIIALLCYVSNAQNKITGKVIDKQGLPLTGATIILPDMNKGTVADKNGSYEFVDIPSGKTRMQFSFMGYASEVKTIILTGSVVNVDVVLTETVIEAEEIVVSGGYSSTQHENAVKIDVLKLDPAEVKATPNFVEVLAKVPGVDMISKGSGVSKPVIRGLSMNDILVLNNNVRYENYQYSSHHPLGIDEFGVGDVEVIKGPASLLYGSDAIGGVVNFIKEKPASQHTIAADYNLHFFSNTLGMTNNLGVKGSSGNFFGGIRAGQKTNADFLQGGGEFAANTRFNDYSVKANAGISGKAGLFQLFYDYNQQKLGLAEEEAIEAITERGRASEMFYQQFNTHMVSSQNKIFLGRAKLDVNAAYQRTALAHIGEPREYELEMALATTTYEAKLYLPSDEKSEYIIGLQGMNQVNTNINDRETILLPNAVANNYSAFGLLQYSFFDRLKFQAGARYDYRTLISEAVGEVNSAAYRAPLDKSYGSFSGSAGATYHLSEQLLFRGNVAAAFRTPNLAELTSNGPHEERYEVGDNTLVPEKSYEADLGLHYHVENLSVDLACFYNRVNQYIYISPTGTESSEGLPIYQYMQNNSELYGGEAGVHFHPESLKWLHVEGSFSTVTGVQDNGNYLPFIPAHKLNFEVRAEKSKTFFMKDTYIALRLNTAFSQKNVAPDETATPGYSLFDITIGGSLKFQKQVLQLAFSANNFFDTKYTDHLSTLKEVGMYNPGRNITFTLKVPLVVSTM